MWEEVQHLKRVNFFVLRCSNHSVHWGKSLVHLALSLDCLMSDLFNTFTLYSHFYTIKPVFGNGGTSCKFENTEKSFMIGILKLKFSMWRCKVHALPFLFSFFMIIIWPEKWFITRQHFFFYVSTVPLYLRWHFTTFIPPTSWRVSLFIH